MVPAVSCARPGEASRLTKPSPPSSLVVERAEDVRRHRDVVDGEAQEQLLRVALAAFDEGAQGLVVVGGAGDGLVEDGRVGGDAGDGELVHQALQLARFDEAAAHVVQPDALPEAVATLAAGSFRFLLHRRNLRQTPQVPLLAAERARR